MPTPIEEGRSLGPKSGAALRRVGVTTVEELQELGWEEALIRLAEDDPRWINANMAYGLMAAIDGIDWRTLGAERKAAAQRACARLRRSSCRR